MIIPKLEKQIGIEIYATKTTGIGGAIRQSVDDFAVEEVLVDGSKAEINNPAKTPVLGSSPIKNRYLLCVLVKRNWDTFEPRSVVAEHAAPFTNFSHLSKRWIEAGLSNAVLGCVATLKKYKSLSPFEIEDLLLVYTKKSLKIY